MKTRLIAVLATTATAAVLLAGCVSSKKYKSSQAALQQVRNDSARLAQQITSLNGNVHDLEEKNSAIQRSLDSASNNYATQQKSLNYYQNYFSQQQTAMSQVGEDIKGAMSQAGLSNEDVQQVNNVIYVRLDEGKVFKKNSTAVTTSGKQALNSLAQVIRNRSNVNVFVNDGDSSSGATNTGMSSMGNENNATTMNNESGNMSSGMSSSAAPKHHRASHHGMAARKSSAGTSGSARSGAARSSNGGVASSADTGRTNATATTHRRVHRKSAGTEGSMTYYNNNMPRTRGSRSWALKEGRMNTVANNFLQNGVPKVNISLKQPAANGNPTNNNIAVVITPMMGDFNPQSGSSSSAAGK